MNHNRVRTLKMTQKCAEFKNPGCFFLRILATSHVLTAFSFTTFFAHFPDCKVVIPNSAVLVKYKRHVPTQVLPHHLFLPVPYTEWPLFFNSSCSREAWRRCGQSYVMHVFNKMSSRAPAVSGCAYRQAAEMYCPESLRQSLSLAGSF